MVRTATVGRKRRPARALPRLLVPVCVLTLLALAWPGASTALTLAGPADPAPAPAAGALVLTPQYFNPDHAPHLRFGFDVAWAAGRAPATVRVDAPVGFDVFEDYPHTAWAPGGAYVEAAFDVARDVNALCAGAGCPTFAAAAFDARAERVAAACTHVAARTGTPAAFCAHTVLQQGVHQAVIACHAARVRAPAQEACVAATFAAGLDAACGGPRARAAADALACWRATLGAPSAASGAAFGVDVSPGWLVVPRDAADYATSGDSVLLVRYDAGLSRGLPAADTVALRVSVPVIGIDARRALPETGPGADVTWAVTVQDATVAVAAVRARPGGDIAESLAGSATVDRTAPVITPSLSAAPAATGWFLAPVDLTVAAADPVHPAQRVAVQVCAAASCATAPARATLRFADEGVFTWSASATDEAGNVATASSPPSGVRVDVTPPTLTVPAAVTVEATSMHGAVVAFSTVAVDAASGVASHACAPASPAPLPLGVHTVTCTAVDHAGWQTVRAFPVSVLDSTPPDLTITLDPPAPNGLDGWFNTPVRISVRASDVASAVPTLTLDVGDGVARPVTGDVTVGDGTFALTARAVDGAGNAAMVGPINVRVDATPPVPPVVALRDSSGASAAPDDVTFARTATLDVVTPASGAVGALAYAVAFEPGAPPLGSDAWRDALPSVVTLPDVDGVHAVHVATRDAAGNVAAAATAALRLDRVAPAVPTLGLADRLTGAATAAQDRDLVVTLDHVAATDVHAWALGVTDTPPALADAAWSLAAPMSFKLPATDGSYDVRAWVRDVAGNVAEPAVATVTLDTVAPDAVTGLAVTDPVTGSSAWTNARTLDVAFTAPPDASGFLLTVDDAVVPAWDDARWSATAPARVALAEARADGPVTVRVWVKDAAGNVQTSAAAASVTLDTRPPTAPVGRLQDGAGASAAPDTVTNDRVVALVIDADAVDATSTREVAVTSSAAAPAAALWGAAWPATVTLDAFDGEQTFFLHARDAAGNAVTPVPVTLRLDTQAPPLPVVTLTDAATGSRAYAASRTVALQVAAGSSEAPFRYFVTASAAAPDATAPGWVAAPPTTHTFPPGDGPRTLRVFVRDTAGNVQADPGAATIVVDTTPPSAPVATLRDRTGASAAPEDVTSGRDVALVVASDSTDATTDVTRAVTFTSDAPDASAWRADWPAIVTLPAADGLHVAFLHVRDSAGNRPAPVAVAIALDTAPPEAPTLAVADPVTASPTWTRTRDVDVTLDHPARADVHAWAVTLTAAAPALDDAAWRVTAPAAFTLPDQDGLVRVFAFARDRAGNVAASATAAVTLDRVAPGAPSAFTVTDARTGATAWTASRALAVSFVPHGDAAAFILALDDALPPAWNDARWASAPDVIHLAAARPDGVVTVRAWSRDAAGNVGAAAVHALTLDTAAPTSAVHLDGANVRATLQADVRVTAADVNGTLAHVELWRRALTADLADRGWTLHASGVDVGNVTFVAPTSGRFELAAVAQDAAGNRGPEPPRADVTVTLDTQAPELADRTEGRPLQGTDFTVAAAVTDRVSAVTAHASVGIDGVVMSVPLLLRGDGLFAATVAVPASARALDVTLSAADEAGNAVTTATRAFDVEDVTPPRAPSVVHVPPPGAAAGTTRFVDVRFTAAPADAGDVDAWLATAAPRTPALTDERWTAAAPSVLTLEGADGPRRVTVWVRDHAGNLNAAGFDVELDRVAPRVGAYPGPERISTNTPVAFPPVPASDDGSGVVATSWWIPSGRPDVDDSTRWVFTARGVFVGAMNATDAAGNFASRAFTFTVFAPTPPPAPVAPQPAGTPAGPPPQPTPQVPSPEPPVRPPLPPEDAPRDVEPPVTRVTVPRGVVASPFTLRFATDDDATVSWRVVGGAAGTGDVLLLEGEGVVVVAFRAVDAAGNTEDEREVRLELDGAAPAVSDVRFDAAAAQVGSRVAISATVTDAALERVTARVTASDGRSVAAVPLADDGSGTHRGSFTVPSLGTFTVEVTATDAFGRSTAAGGADALTAVEPLQSAAPPLESSPPPPARGIPFAAPGIVVLFAVAAAFSSRRSRGTT